MEGEDGLDEAGLEGGHGLLDEGADLRVGPVHRLLTRGKGSPTAPATGYGLGYRHSVAFVDPGT